MSANQIDMDFNRLPMKFNKHICCYPVIKVLKKKHICIYTSQKMSEGILLICKKICIMILADLIIDRSMFLTSFFRDDLIVVIILQNI